MTIFIAFPLINGCKKGPDDPCISLKSRDGRLCRTWKLTSVISSLFIVPGNYDGTHYTVMGSGSGTGTFTITFGKNGVTTYDEECLPSGGTSAISSGTGTWIWKDTDKKKTYIQIVGGGSILFSAGTYYIDELRHNKLILKDAPYESGKYIFESQ